ncbi:MAG: hypothetical protein K8T10_03425 [Candidatus Eremiobacteraeota bacterium]|nr:hypothetical protein [Candidatus Eremiobacteraeota bacterium]
MGAFQVKFIVELEKKNTWPTAFLKRAKQSKDLIINYHKEEKRIDHLCENDIGLRCRPPLNEYEHEYKILIHELDKILNGCNIIGYHCTRLISSEIISIKRDGMKTLSPELIQKRFISAYKQEQLSKKDFESLTNSPIVKKHLCNKYCTRTGMIWFCANRSTLKKCNLVYRLFKYWGGEAVYNGHENDPIISNTLKSIGVPCIIKCSVPISEVDKYPPDFCKRFLSYFISNDIEYPEPPASFDMYTERDLKSIEVLEIIEKSNPVFRDLTDYMNWSEDY